MMDDIVKGNFDDDLGHPTISSSSSVQLDESVSPPSESECLLPLLLVLWCLLLSTADEEEEL